MAKIISFRAEYGTSVEIKGIWHKLYAAIEVAPESDDEPMDQVKEKAWNTVVHEVEKQIEDIVG